MGTNAIAAVLVPISFFTAQLNYVSVNLFPSLCPRIVDPLWFTVDQPVDDDAELTQLEKEHKNQLKAIEEKYNNITPIGKLYSEHPVRDEEEDEADGDGESNNEEDPDADMIDDRDSVDDADLEVHQGAADSPAWAD